MIGRRRFSTAEEWLAHLLRDDVRDEDRRALDAWLEESPAHRVEFELLERGWQLAGDLAGDPDLAIAVPRLPVTRPSRRGAWRRGLLAAAAVTSVIVTALWLGRGQDPVEQHRTTQGEQRTVALTDGSRIRLNTATTLDVVGSREVMLRAGEAFFDVSPQQSGRFSVDAGVGKVTVLGTRFNVLRTGGDVVVSVLEGRVAVDVGGWERQLAAGQTLEIRGGEPRLLAGGSDLARVKAWQEGKVEFDRTPLSEAVRELSRYTPEVLRVAEPSLEELRVSGVFRIESLADLSSVRFALENSLPVTLRATGDALELVRAGD